MKQKETQQETMSKEKRVVFFEGKSWYHRTKELQDDLTTKYGKKGGFETPEEAEKSYWEYEKRYPHQLSGGQQQRVAVARALAPNPHLLLMDEPFSNIDRALKEKMRQEIRSILKAEHVTCIFVTHDATDVEDMSDRVIQL